MLFTQKSIAIKSKDSVDLAPDQLRYLLLLVVQKLNWDYRFTDEDVIVIRKPSTWKRFGTTSYLKVESYIADNHISSVRLIAAPIGMNLVKQIFKMVADLAISMDLDEIDSNQKQQQQPQNQTITPSDKLPPTWTSKPFNPIDYLIPTKDYLFTPLIFYYNILIFFVMILAGGKFTGFDPQLLINWGSLSPDLLHNGHFWTLLTGVFVHIDFGHLIGNMLFLLGIGKILEPYIGKTKFVISYIIAGIFGSIMSVTIMDAIFMGSSGAVLALFGIFFIFSVKMVEEGVIQKTTITIASLLTVYALINGLFFSENINNVGHFSGFVSGLFLGFIFWIAIEPPKYFALIYTSVSLLILGLILAINFSLTTNVIQSGEFIENINETNKIFILKYPHLDRELNSNFYTDITDNIPGTPDIDIYLKKMESFHIMESRALEIMKVKQKNKQFLHDLKTIGIYFWKENYSLAQSFNELDLPQAIKEKNLLLEEYCQVRIESYTLIYKSISENTDDYTAQIDECNSRIETIINLITNHNIDP